LRLCCSGQERTTTTDATDAVEKVESVEPVALPFRPFRPNRACVRDNCTNDVCRENGLVCCGKCDRLDYAPLQVCQCCPRVRATMIADFVLNCMSSFSFIFFLHCALASRAVYCNRSCLFVGVWGLEVCYHDNSKLRASILTKLGLQAKVVTISSWLDFGRPVPPGRRSAAVENFWLGLTTASAQCLRLLRALFII